MIAYLICLLLAFAEAVPVYANICRGTDKASFSRLSAQQPQKEKYHFVTKTNKLNKPNNTNGKVRV